MFGSHLAHDVRRAAVLAGATSALGLLTGCPIDGADLAVDIFEAGLLSITQSLVDALATALALP